MKDKGEFLISIPFGFRETVLHPVTFKIASQIFGYESVKKGIDLLKRYNIFSTFKIFALNHNGWYECNEINYSKLRYADGVPAAHAVAFIEGKKKREYYVYHFGILAIKRG